jgi:5-aminolevulinate synthase
MKYCEYFKQFINKTKFEQRYREFVELNRIAGKFPRAYCPGLGREILLWCINDYLGMGQHSKVLNAMHNAIDSMGSGAGGTRNIGGTHGKITELEEELADFHGKESALVFNSGYIANETTISSLAKIIPDLAIFSDRDNHASIIHGIKNSRLEKYIFKHNDIADLEEKLARLPKSRPKLIVAEAVYSMDGKSAPLVEINKLARQYGAFLYIDEVHSVGIFGSNGGGYCRLKAIDSQVDIIQGTLGKAFGVSGGYIAGSSEIVDAIRLTAPGFIFSTALSPVVAAGATESIRHLRSSDEERDKLKALSKKLKHALDKVGISYIDNETHIVPVVIGCPYRTELISKKLLHLYGDYLQPINYPTVASGAERLRITVTACHSEKMIDELALNLYTVMDEVNSQLNVA